MAKTRDRICLKSADYPVTVNKLSKMDRKPTSKKGAERQPERQHNNNIPDYTIISFRERNSQICRDY